MIVSGGENVYFGEVEAAVLTHPDIDAVAVFGVPSEQWGESVHAVVIRRPGSALSAEDLLAFLDGRIASYKRPKSVEFREEPMPMSAAMKVLKRELRAPYWADHRDRPR